MKIKKILTPNIRRRFYRVFSSAIFPAIYAAIFAFFFVADTASGYVLLENSIIGGKTTDVNPQEYLLNLYNIGIGIAGVLAVVMLVFGGIEYITSAVIDTKAEAKKRIWAALGGLLLALVSWLLLNTINTKLVTTNFQIQSVGSAGTVAEGTTGGAGTTAPSGLTQEIADKQVSNFNATMANTGATIQVTSTNGCTDKNGSGCTSFAGIQQSTLDEVKRIATDCGCKVTITGGTETGHEAGAASHGNGAKIDIQAQGADGKETPITKFIMNPKNAFTLGSRTGTNGKVTTTYTDKVTGAEYAYEYRENKYHWDITVPAKNVFGNRQGQGGGGGY